MANPGGIPDAKLVAWYAARFTTAGNGDLVATIPELSGLGADNLFQNNTARQARWHSNIVNGLPTFRFDGNDWYKAAWNQTIPQPYQTFIVLNTRTPFGLDDDEVYFSGFTNPGTSDKHLFAIVDHVLSIVNSPPVPASPPWWMMENAANNQHVVGGTPINQTWYVVRVDFESPNGLITVNGTATTAMGNAGALSSTGITFGAREDGNRGTTGDIAELVFCQDLTALEKVAVQAELLTVYDLHPLVPGWRGWVT
jgi:hypothetical protein